METISKSRYFAPLVIGMIKVMADLPWEKKRVTSARGSPAH